MATIVSSRSFNSITTATQDPNLTDKRPSDGDINIAQGLLIAPRIPTRKYSIGRYLLGTHGKFFTPGAMDERSPSFESADDFTHQSVIQTSNTWTSSSGEALSDHDDIDDRSGYLKEFNHLANKVGNP